MKLKGYVNTKFAVFGMKSNLKGFKNSQFKSKNQRFGVVCGTVESFIFLQSVGKRNRHGDRYRAIISEYLLPEIEVRAFVDMWFQPGSATSHASQQSLDLMRELFGESFISRFAPVDWPPRSC